MSARSVSIGLALVVGLACNGTVVIPAEGDGGSGAANSSTAGSTSSSGAAVPTNCWGCREIYTDWYTSVLPPKDEQCPGAYEAAEQYSDCICGNCTASCPFCPDTGNNVPQCNPCIAAHCAALGDACGADYRVYTPTD